MRQHLRQSKKVAATAIFTAVALSTDYLMLPLSNVKLMDTMVFLGGFIYGPEVGVSVAALSWLIYGTLNPYGAATPGLLAVMIAGESTYGIAGWLMRRTSTAPLTASASIKFGVVGFMCAFFYDFVTNAYTGIYWYGSVLRALVLGIPFAVVHELSDFAFFSVIVPVVIWNVGILGGPKVQNYVSNKSE